MHKNKYFKNIKKALLPLFVRIDMHFDKVKQYLESIFSLTLFQRYRYWKQINF